MSKLETAGAPDSSSARAGKAERSGVDDQIQEMASIWKSRYDFTPGEESRAAVSQWQETPEGAALKLAADEVIDDGYVAEETMVRVRQAVKLA